MKYLIIILSFLFLNLNSIGQITLKIEISSLRNNKGQVFLELIDNAGNQVAGLSKKVENNKCVFTIENLKPGKYSFKYFHDENNNKKIDINFIGIPKEGFGFSKNAKAIFGKPKREETIFYLKKNITLKCSPQYLL